MSHGVFSCAMNTYCMALHSIERFPQQSMSGDATGRSYQFTWKVRTTEPNEPMWQVAGYTGYNIGDALNELDQFDTASFMSNWSVEQQDIDLMSWLVTLDFTPNEVLENIVIDGDAGLEIDFVDIIEPYMRDRNGELIDDAAGQPVGSAPERIRSGILLTYTVYRTVFNPIAAAVMRKCCNANYWNGFPPGHAQIDHVVSRFRKDDALPSGGYHIATYSILVDPNQRLDKLVYLNQGFREKVWNSEESKWELKVIMVDGKPATEPVLLSPDGRADPLGTPNFRTKQQERLIPFNFDF